MYKKLGNLFAAALCLAVSCAYAAPPVAMDTGQSIEASYVKATPVADVVTVAVAVPSITVATVHRQRTAIAQKTSFTAQRPTFCAALYHGKAPVKWRSPIETLS